MDRGPLVAVPMGPLARGQFVKMYLEDAVAAGFLPEAGSQKPEARIKNPESRIQKPESEAEAEPEAEEIEEGVLVPKRPKRRPQGRNKMITPEEDK